MHPGLFSLTPSYFVPDDRFPSLNSFSLFTVSPLLWPLPTLHLLPLPLSTPMEPSAQPGYSTSLSHSNRYEYLLHAQGGDEQIQRWTRQVLCPLTAHHLIVRQTNKKQLNEVWSVFDGAERSPNQPWDSGKGTWTYSWKVMGASHSEDATCCLAEARACSKVQMEQTAGFIWGMALEDWWNLGNDWSLL